jgi:SAM-dependent methyltransferase
MRRRILKMNRTTKRILVGFTALALALLGTLPAGAAVKVAVTPELAGVIGEIVGESADHPMVSGQVVVWRPGYQEIQPPPPECDVIVTGCDSEMDALARHGQVVVGSRTVIAEAELMLYVGADNAKNIRHARDLARADVSVAVASPDSSWLGEASDMLLSCLGVSRTGAEEPWAGAENGPAAVLAGKADAALCWSAPRRKSAALKAIALPEGLRPVTQVVVALSPRARKSDAANGLLAFLASEAARGPLLRAGFRPPSDSTAKRDYTRTASCLAPGLYELVGRSMAAFCRLQRGRCLDVGCGKADLDVVLAKITEMTILGLDISEEALTKARANVKKAGLADRITFIQGDVQKMPLETNSFDVVISRGSYPFWKDKDVAMREILRVLKPGGVALIGGGKGFYFPAPLRQSTLTLLPTRSSLDLASSGGRDRFTLGDLKRVMEAIGVTRFRLIDDPGCRQCGGWVQFWK